MRTARMIQVAAAASAALAGPSVTAAGLGDLAVAAADVRALRRRMAAGAA
ncbi:hypothetical protein ABT300_21720 [Streptomyces sp. NPDC001027]